MDSCKGSANLCLNTQPVGFGQWHHYGVQPLEDVSTCFETAVDLAEEAIDVEVHRLNHAVCDRLQLDTGEKKTSQKQYRET